MFMGCNSLKSLNNMSFLFYECELLTSLSDISIWNIINVDNMEQMFYNCKSLITLPNISKWNTLNVTNMEKFYNSKLLITF